MRFFFISFGNDKKKNIALAGVAQWIKCHLRTKRLQFGFPVRAHVWVSGQVPVGGTQEATTN